jgi:hypothetical protein
MQLARSDRLQGFSYDEELASPDAFEKGVSGFQGGGGVPGSGGLGENGEEAGQNVDDGGASWKGGSMQMSREGVDAMDREMEAQGMQ